MSETLIFRKKAAPSATTATTATKKSGTTRKRTAKDGTEKFVPSEPLTQKFFATHTERFINIKFANATFSVEKDNVLVKHIRGVENKDLENVNKILDFVKSLVKSNVSFEKICKRLNDTQTEGNFSQSIRTYYNALNKPLTIAAPVTLSTLDTHPHINHYGDENHGTHEDLHL